MDRYPARRSSLFLMELIISILFFSVASTVCVRFFVKSHTLEQESIALNHALNAVSSVAEIFRNQDDPFPVLEQQFPQGMKSENSYHFFYTEDWTLCNKEAASYTILLNLQKNGSFTIADIRTVHSGETIYQLSVKKYNGLEAQ